MLLLFKRYKFCILLLSVFLFSNCVSSKKLALREQMFKAETKLGIELDKRDKLELYVECANWIGTPYKYGGKTKNGTDCSGFTNAIYNKVYNKSLQRNSEMIYKKNCKRISKNRLRPGDLIFFRMGSSRKIDHVGIYLKDGRFIHASTKAGVRVDNIGSKHYESVYYRSGRVY